MARNDPMPFHSILFRRTEDRAGEETGAAPDCLRDLNLDQAIRFIAMEKRDYDLAPFFHAPLRDLNAIAYRQEVMRGLEEQALLQVIETFSLHMRAVHSHLDSAKDLYYSHHRQGWLLAAAVSYCEAVQGLLRDLGRLAPASRGLRTFRDYLTGYAAAPAFVEFATDAAALHRGLSGIRYCLIIKGNSITVEHCGSETGYATEIEAVFAKFRRGTKPGRRMVPPPGAGMNQVEVRILERVARLYPETFRALDEFCARHEDYLDPTIVAFEREIQFYTAYLANNDVCRAGKRPAG